MATFFKKKKKYKIAQNAKASLSLETTDLFSSQTSQKTSTSVWPDLAIFRHFGKT